jgi:hypothetical protein
MVSESHESAQAPTPKSVGGVTGSPCVLWGLWTTDLGRKPALANGRLQDAQRNASHPSFERFGSAAIADVLHVISYAVLCTVSR